MHPNYRNSPVRFGAAVTSQRPIPANLAGVHARALRGTCESDVLMR